MVVKKKRKRAEAACEDDGAEITQEDAVEDDAPLPNKKRKAKKLKAAAPDDEGEAEEAVKPEDTLERPTKKSKKKAALKHGEAEESTKKAADAPEKPAVPKLVKMRKSVKDEDKEAANAGDAEDGDAGGLDKLMRLRALLTPAGFGESAADQAAAAVAKKAEDDDEAEADQHVAEDGHGDEVAETVLPEKLPDGPDWTSRYHVVRASDPPTPIEQLKWELHPALERALRKCGFNALFPIQAAVIPLLSRSADTFYDANSPYSCDVCVAAPTGQGKTLAYAVPIVQSLLGRLRAKPRALVILPTRDLAMQVYRTFEKLRNGLGKGVTQIQTHCLIGQKSFAEEQRSLRQRAADVVVCTPGRLSDHALGRDGQLDLSALRWFVADEADRLLTQASHRWLDVLERVTAPTPEEAAGRLNGFPTAPRVQKLLLSATMTWNPQKLAMLNLRRAMFFISSQTGQYATPKELKQHFIHCRSETKPLALLTLLDQIARGELRQTLSSDKVTGSGRVVVFCSSVDTAHRLSRLLQLFALLAGAMDGNGSPPVTAAEEDGQADHDDAEADGETAKAKPVATQDVLRNLSAALRDPGFVAEFSSTLSQGERTSLLSRFRKGTVKCLICSDVVARGIDIPEVEAVVNYTTPEHLSTYIHRCGRTARAGKSGHTFTFVARPAMPQFEKMLKESADCWERIKEHALPIRASDTQQAWYVRALKLLELCLNTEKDGDLPATRPLKQAEVDTWTTKTSKQRGTKAAGTTKIEVDPADAQAPLEDDPAEEAEDNERQEPDAAAVEKVAADGADKATTPKDKRRPMRQRQRPQVKAGASNSMLDFLKGLHGEQFLEPGR
eukprot:TRINITY_DN64679_c0_g1_i1.p1 TRINITY_DN64679_c0_g1~~TRINITY_DN64679_c0_g1_i1.p1  ORF type:complete len:841 (+),score=229.29 TRINITY_DN64679_c0_g1_i1:85-2607(+)